MQEVTLTVYDDDDVFRELSKWHREGKVNEHLFQFFKKEFETTGKMPSFTSNSMIMKQLGFKKIGDVITDKDFQWPYH